MGTELTHQVPRRGSASGCAAAVVLGSGNNRLDGLKAEPDVPEEEEEDRDDKSWRTRGESSPSVTSPRSLGDSPIRTPRSWDAAAAALTSATRPERRVRQLFWRNIVRQYNFVNQEDERVLLLSLTDGIDWTTMPMLPRAFMARHKEIYYLICRGDYERSSMIQRDVTRTFSIFERSQLPQRERDVNAQQRALFRVLNAVAEAEDGYCQGMNFIAALFLVEGLDEADAYALFLYLLKKRQLARIYHHSSTFLDDYLFHFERMLQSELPDLYAHLQAQGFAIPMYGIEWFTTLFSLSTKPDLACAIFDLFFVGVQDIFLRMGLAILKLLEAPLMCMSFEDFLRDFKPLVRQIDPYHAVLKALAFRPNAHVAVGEDTTAHIARLHYTRAADVGNVITTPSGDTIVRPPRAFLRHRSLPPELADAIELGDFAQVSSQWLTLTALRDAPLHALVLANEILHFAVWHNHVAIALFAIRQCGADVDNADDTGLTPLHFAVMQNQPDIVRLLLCCGADPRVCGGRWSGAAADGLSPYDTALHWKFGDTTAARLVLEREVCLCCNTKWDAFAFAFRAKTCELCQFTYCGRGTEACIKRHQCPAVYQEWRQRLHERQLRHQPVNSGDGCGSAPSSSSSRRSSRSTSDASSSFVYINSPASDLPAGRSRSTTATDENETPEEASSLDALAGWFGGAVNDDDFLHADLSRGIDFPDRPEWYCNACHSVFTFFGRGNECRRCSGFFCADDFDARSKLCRRGCSHD